MLAARQFPESKQMSFEGHVENGMVVLDQPLPFPDGTPVRVEPIAITSGSFWQSMSIDELAKQQGVTVPTSVDELFGGWPADELDDHFGQTLEQTLEQWRRSESEQSFDDRHGVSGPRFPRP
jgi:hypothetical protein